MITTQARNGHFGGAKMLVSLRSNGQFFNVRVSLRRRGRFYTNMCAKLRKPPGVEVREMVVPSRRNDPGLQKCPNAARKSASLGGGCCTLDRIVATKW
eukprot:9477270-Lingulodinium_polyedra.AAC.1